MKKLKKKLKSALLQKVELLEKDGNFSSNRREARKDIKELSKAIQRLRR